MRVVVEPRQKLGGRLVRSHPTTTSFNEWRVVRSRVISPKAALVFARRRRRLVQLKKLLWGQHARLPIPAVYSCTHLLQLLAEATTSASVWTLRKTPGGFQAFVA